MKINALALATLLVASSASATVLTFDDLSNGQAISNYGGINWDSGWYAWDTNSNYPAKSSPVVAYAHSYSIGASFQTASVFDGAYFSGNGTVNLAMYLGGALVSSTSVENLADLGNAPIYISSGYSGLVDRVVVNDSSFDHWIMDDFTYNASSSNSVPEPTSLALMGLGLAGLGYYRRKAKKQ